MMISFPSDLKRTDAICKATKDKEIGKLTFAEFQSIQRIFGPLENVSPRDISVAEDAIRRLGWDQPSESQLPETDSVHFL